MLCLPLRLNLAAISSAQRSSRALMALMSTPPLLPRRRRNLGLEGPSLGLVTLDRGRGREGAYRGAEECWRDAVDSARRSVSESSLRSACAKRSYPVVRDGIEAWWEVGGGRWEGGRREDGYRKDLILLACWF